MYNDENFIQPHIKYVQATSMLGAANHPRLERGAGCAVTVRGGGVMYLIDR
jgi:hypothetical protein